MPLSADKAALTLPGQVREQPESRVRPGKGGGTSEQRAAPGPAGAKRPPWGGAGAARSCDRADGLRADAPICRGLALIRG